MNEDLYKSVMKQLTALDVEKISDIDVRHITGERDFERNNERENNIQIDIYYKD